jgi:hypothetical protein
VASQRGPWPLDGVVQPPHLGGGQLGLVGEHVTVAHPLDIDLVVGGNHGQGPLHPEVDGSVELTCNTQFVNNKKRVDLIICFALYLLGYMDNHI